MYLQSFYHPFPCRLAIYKTAKLCLFDRFIASYFYTMPLVVLLFLTLLPLSLQTKLDSNPDIELKTPELARKYGYPIEVHNVLTEDGYNVQLHRIPHGRSGIRSARRVPVLLQHGLAGSSADWILLGPGKGLGYILAEEGYDVWLGNNRGNIYSKNNTISFTDRHYWNYSYHELGIYDFPAVIDYILEETGYEKLLYIGHSQGTTQFWVMASEKPEYNSKISLMIGLAPAAFTGHIKGTATKYAKLTYTGVWVGETFGYPEFRARSAWGKFIGNLFCQNAATTQFICNNMLFMLAGFSSSELNTENLTVIIGHVPAGGSWKQFVHYGQGYIFPNHFRKFDYLDSEKNQNAYGQPVPPEYDLEKVRAPIALFSSENDWLATPADVELLTERLNSIVFHHKITTKTFNHYDFIWGKSAMQQVFLPILQLLKQYR